MAAISPDTDYMAGQDRNTWRHRWSLESYETFLFAIEETGDDQAIAAMSVLAALDLSAMHCHEVAKISGQRIIACLSR
jgi:hypothetical protein